MFTDPRGEIIPLLVIGAAIIGAYVGGSMANGTWNPTKWDWKSGDTWLGIVGGGILGAGSAVVGAGIATSLAAKGVSSAFWATAIGGAGGGAIQGGGFSLLPGGDGKFLKGMGIGALSGFVGGGAGHWASQNIANVMINGISVSSPVIKGAIGGLFGGAAGGYAGGFTGGFLSTGSLSQAHQAGLQSSVMGAGIGTIMGAATAFSMAKSQGIDPWSGKLTSSEGNTIARHHTNAENMNLIRQSKEMLPSRYSDYDFLGVDFEASPNFNGIQEFGNAYKGAFIEMNLPNNMLNFNPSPLYPNSFRINTGLTPFSIRPQYNPQYYRNFNLRF